MQLDKDAAIDRTVRQVTGLTLWLGLLLVTYWWVADGGVTDLAHKASELTSLGRLTGLWAADLLLVQVLLMSRLPPLEHAYGRDWLARIHRVVGLLSFYLMISHIVLIIAGHASVQWSAVLSTVWDLIINYGGMLLAVAGTGCLIMVAVTSIKAAWRRLRYESWHLLHLYAYVGVGLAVPHQLWAGQQFLQSTASTSGAARATGNGLLGSFGSPSDVVSVYLTGRRLDKLPLRAGQSINVPAGMDTRQPVIAVHRAERPRYGSPLKRSARAVHGWRPCGRAPGCCSRARTNGSAAAPGPSERWFSPVLGSASPHCVRWWKASTTRPVRRSSFSATPRSPCLSANSMCSPQGPSGGAPARPTAYPRLGPLTGGSRHA